MLSSSTTSTSYSILPSTISQCAVCGDMGFFRRSIWSKKHYKCRGNGECQLIREKRNSCRFCRLKQCLAVGMNPKAIQGERVLPQAQDENNKSIRIVSSSIVSKNVIISCIQNSRSIGTQTEYIF